MPNRPLIEMPLYSWKYEEDISRSLLADGNMEAVSTASWSAYQSSLSKETASPQSGVRNLRVTRSSGVTYFAYQDLVTYLNNPIKITGYARGNGVHAPSVWVDTSVAPTWTGTSSTSWQYFSFTKIPTGNRYVALGVYLTGGSDGYVEFDDIQTIPYTARTNNTGSLSSLANCQLGNGYVTSSFPTIIGGGQRGMTFASASSQVLQVYNILVSGTYTVCLHFMNLNPAANNGYIFDASGSGGVGYSLLTPGNIFAISSGTGYLNGSLLTSGVSTIPYGSINTLVCTGMTLSVVSKIVFGASSGIALPLNGKFYTIAIYSGTLTPIQIRSWHKRQMALINRY